MPPIESGPPGGGHGELRRESREHSAGLERATREFDDEAQRLQRQVVAREAERSQTLVAEGGRTPALKEKERLLDDAHTELDQFAQRNARSPFVLRLARGEHEPTFKARLAERGLSDVVELVSKRGFNRETRAEAVRTVESKGYVRLTTTRDIAIPAEREAGILSDYYYLPPRERSVAARGEEEHDGDGDDLTRAA